METVNFSCGHCGKLMAVGKADLGIQVRCPHCQQVVQAPQAATASAAPPPFEPVFPSTAAQEHESIFTPSQEAGEDLFGAAPVSRVEVPAETPPANSAPSATHPDVEATKTWGPLPAVPTPAGQVSRDPENWSAPPAPAETEPEAVAPPQVQRTSRESMFVPLLLVFLIPYAVVITAVLGYMLYLHNTRPSYDPLERMLDQDPKNGGPQRIKHDAPLPGKLKTSLKQKLQIGDIEVLPVKVELSPEKDLVLHLKLRNLSQDVLFNPLPDTFSRHKRESMDTPKPYTFLDGGPKRIYGADVEWLKGEPGQEKNVSNGILLPGEEMVALLRTDMLDRPKVKVIETVTTPLLWRVQVRRGFIEVRGKDVSATAVIGVEFPASAIERQAGG